MVAERHPAFDWPSVPTVRLWRYMDLDKLVWFLTNGVLFFSRAHLLGDPFEGSSPLANISDYHRLEKSMGGKPAVAKHFTASKKAFLPYYLVNCWHISDIESAAMWRLYTTARNSVALVTRFHMLAYVLPDTVYVGKLRYIDYTKDRIPEGNVFHPIMYKRKSFEHERELRAVKMDDGLDVSAVQALYDASEIEWKLSVEGMTPGLNVGVDIAHMVESIRVSPGSPVWFVEAVQKVVELCGYNFSVERSELDRDPVY